MATNRNARRSRGEPQRKFARRRSRGYIGMSFGGVPSAKVLFRPRPTMKPICCLVALPMLTLAIGAQTVAVPQLPDRPAAALTMYKDRLCPVVGAEGNAPIIFADGKQVALGASASIALSAGARYAGGFVAIADVYSTDVPISNDPETAATSTIEMKATMVDVRASLTPDIDIPDTAATSTIEMKATMVDVR